MIPGGGNIMNPLLSVKGSLITGFVIAILFAVLGINNGAGFHELGLARWLHIIAGVTWIGLLYYFNAVQVPAMAVAAADKGGPGGAGVSKYVAPLALRWFRWSAVVTWVTGVWYLARFGALGGAAMLGFGGDEFNSYQFIIGVGAWLGTIMLFNVWVFIWPNQKKLLGLVPATDGEKAAARKPALYASRINYVLSIPMLMCMAGATHGLPF
jgi:uncharacterized membrane protein